LKTVELMRYHDDAEQNCLFDQSGPVSYPFAYVQARAIFRMHGVTEHWGAMHGYWRLLGEPLKPPAEAVRAYERELGLANADAVLLGVTPELAGLGRTLLAIDSSEQMVLNVWPGDSEGRRAIVGDWLDLPVARAGVDVVLGDGCLVAVGSPAMQRGLFSEAARVLKGDGRGAIRTFASPLSPDPLDAVRALAMAGRVSSFHELKWRVAFARAFHDPERVVAVRAIRDAFNETFPDRAVLAAATGWSRSVIDTMDLYEKSDAIYIFATAGTLAEAAREFFGDVGIVSSGGYPFAGQCPLIVFRKPLRR
jgi:SAM-dependent methyltransferase